MLTGERLAACSSAFTCLTLRGHVVLEMVTSIVKDVWPDGLQRVTVVVVVQSPITALPLTSHQQNSAESC